MCLTFGVFFFVLAMAILVVDESILEFNLDSGILLAQMSFILGSSS